MNWWTSGFESLEGSITKLLDTLDVASEHIQQVLDNKIEANPKARRPFDEAHMHESWIASAM